MTITKIVSWAEDKELAKSDKCGYGFEDVEDSWLEGGSVVVLIDTSGVQYHLTRMTWIDALTRASRRWWK